MYVKTIKVETWKLPEDSRTLKRGEEGGRLPVPKLLLINYVTHDPVVCDRKRRRGGGGRIPGPIILLLN